MRSESARGAAARLLFLTVLFGSSGLSAQQSGEKKSPPPPPPPPEVIVSKPQVRTVTDFASFKGRIAALETIELRAVVRGYLQSVHFQDGQLVKAGDLLFEIDPRPYKVALDLASAQVASANAGLRLAKAEQTRLKSLFSQKVVSQQEVDAAEAKLSGHEAELLIAEAKRAKAALDLSHTMVRAPRSGLIGRSQVSPGNLINAAGLDMLLATIVSIDPMTVHFEVDETSLRRLRIGPDNQAPERLLVFVAAHGQHKFEYQGVIDFVDNRINPRTGTLSIRGILPNKARDLIDGASVQVRVPFGDPHEAILLPESAVETANGKKFVYLVNQKNIAERRFVELGGAFDGSVAVSQGIVASDNVIIKGNRRVQDGMEVQTVTLDTRSVQSP